mgnify:FL=1
MKIVLIIILVLLLLVVFLRKNEHFSLETHVDKTDLLDMVHSFGNNPTVNIVGKELDDELITKFITNDEVETIPSLDYAEEKPKDVNMASSLEEIEEAKANYDHLIESKTQKQNIKLNNLLLELQKINKLETKLEC